MDHSGHQASQIVDGGERFKASHHSHVRLLTSTGGWLCGQNKDVLRLSDEMNTIGSLYWHSLVVA